MPSITWCCPTDNTTCINDVLRRQEDPDELLVSQVFSLYKLKCCRVINHYVAIISTIKLGHIKWPLRKTARLNNKGKIYIIVQGNVQV